MVSRVVTFVFIGILASITSSVFAYNTGHPPAGMCNVGSGQKVTGHEWLICKAVEYLKYNENSVAGKYPLEDFLPLLYSGVQYADKAGRREGEKGKICIWDYFVDEKSFACDTLHHYGQVADIGTVLDLLVKEVFFKVAHPGDFAAPFYADVLYEQAIKFWPGGTRPRFSELPVRNGGYIEVSANIFDKKTQLGNTWIGGLPYSQEWPYWVEGSGDLAQEDVASALTYLGWAIHLIQDITIPYHAQNIASEEHQDFEDEVDKRLKEGFDDYTIWIWNLSSSVADSGNVEESANQIMDYILNSYDTLEENMSIAITYTIIIIEKFFREIPPSDICDSGKIFDCMDNCVSEATAQSWIGDGHCDDGKYGMVLMCDRFDNDGGDCSNSNCPPIEYLDSTYENEHALFISDDYVLSRSIGVSQNLGWTIYTNGKQSLSRNALGENRYKYFNHSTGIPFCAFLTAWIDGGYKRVSNAIGYTVGQPVTNVYPNPVTNETECDSLYLYKGTLKEESTNEYSLSISSDYTLSRTVGEHDNNLTWIIVDADNGGLQVMGRSAHAETEYRYFGNSEGKHYCAFLKGPGGRRVSNFVSYTIPPSCASTEVLDCSQQCVDSAKAQSWTGDGYCDDGRYGMNLTCDKFNNDGGDCNT